MIRTVEQSAMRKDLFARVAICSLDLFLLLSRPHQCRLCRADDEQRFRARPGDVRHGRRRVLLGLCAVGGTQQHHPRKARRPALDRPHHGHLGLHLRPHRLCHRPVQLHGDPLSARVGRGRAVPRLCAVLHLLVPRRTPRPHQFGLHLGLADRGGERRADFDRAPRAQRPLRPARLAGRCSSSRRSRPW